MAKFEPDTYDLGHVRLGGMGEAVFVRSSQFPAIQKVTSSCGCSDPSYNQSQTILRVQYQPGATLPEGALPDGFMDAHKHITILYQDGTEQLVYLKARVS